MEEASTKHEQLLQEATEIGEKRVTKYKKLLMEAEKGIEKAKVVQKEAEDVKAEKEELEKRVQALEEVCILVSMC